MVGWETLCVKASRGEEEGRSTSVNPSGTTSSKAVPGPLWTSGSSSVKQRSQSSWAKSASDGGRPHKAPVTHPVLRERQVPGQDYCSYGAALQALRGRDCLTEQRMLRGHRNGLTGEWGGVPGRLNKQGRGAWSRWSLRPLAFQTLCAR